MQAAKRIRKTYRVEEYKPLRGWVLRRPDAVGLSAIAANRLAESEREFERYYATGPYGVKPVRIRVTCEQTGIGLWSA